MAELKAAEESGELHTLMHSGAAHDTMMVASRVPSGMVFVPCKDGISHSPEEDADPADVALGAEVILKAINRAVGRTVKPCPEAHDPRRMRL